MVSLIKKILFFRLKIHAAQRTTTATGSVICKKYSSHSDLHLNTVSSSSRIFLNLKFEIFLLKITIWQLVPLVIEHRHNSGILEIMYETYPMLGLHICKQSQFASLIVKAEAVVQYTNDTKLSPKSQFPKWTSRSMTLKSDVTGKTLK